MKCSQCSFNDSKVVESRDVADGEAIRRRRECIKCSHRFTTYERIERPQLIVVKSDGTRELFDRQKLLAGLYRASQKTSVTSVELEQLVTRIEDKLYGCGETDIPTNQIGQYAMDELANLNEVAYVRFASVYRRFKDIAGFERELSVVKRHRTDPVNS
jgi:transcriptional repressor NrdR